MTEERGDYLTRFKPQSNSLADKPVSTYLPKKVDEIIRDKSKVPNRAEFIRNAILEKMDREGLLPTE